MTEGVVTYVESRANGGRKIIFVLVKYDALGINLSVLKRSKSLSEGSCAEKALLFICALEHRKKLAEELALYGHISLEALGVVKRKGLILGLEGIEIKGVGAKVLGNNESRVDVACKFKIKCVFDMGNFVLEGVDPYPEAYELLKKDIAYFHIKDALAQGAIVPPGRGDAKIQAILSAHREYAKEDFFVSLEPHLQTFSGLNALVGRSFENPYKYENEKVAFTDAVNKLKEMI